MKEITEERKIAYLERQYLCNRRSSLYTMLENADINWFWTEPEIDEFDRLFANHMDILRLAKRFNRTPLEIVLLTIDRELKGKIRGGLNVKPTN